MQRRTLLLAIGLWSCSVSQAEAPTAEQGLLPVVAATVSIPLIQAQKPEKPTVLIRTVERKSKLEAELFSRIAFSEGGFLEHEAQALLQALEDMRGSKFTLLETMYRQCARVTKRKPYTDPRQIWVSNLPIRGLEVPYGWIECTGKDERGKPTPEGCTGTWAYTAKGWAKFREYTQKLYWSGVVPAVVEGTIVQWGGDMDYHYGVSRGFCPLKSPGTVNTYWGVPDKNVGKCLPVDEDKIKKSRILTADIKASRIRRMGTISAKLAGGTAVD